MEKVVELLKQTPDCYEDFIIAMRSDLKRNPDLVQPVLEYLKDNGNRTTSDVLGFFWRLEKGDASLGVFAEELRQKAG